MMKKLLIFLFFIGCNTTNNSMTEKKSVSIDELQTHVWGHSSKLETHTVETHIYRLRKKISKKFNNNEFIISTKEGYNIK